MRRLLTQMEQLAAAPFILVVGMAGGVLRGIPPFFLPSTDALLHSPSSAASSNLTLLLIRSPIRFLGAVILIAIGRQLPGTGSPLTPRPLVPTDREATT